MNILALNAAGPYCTLASYRQGGAWIPSEQTNIALTFQREIAKLRGEIADDYERVNRDDCFEMGGFK